MESSYSENQLRTFASWLNQPLTPGVESALNRWLTENPENQETWEDWQKINGRAKLLQIVPGDVNADWAALRDELGFVHVGKSRRRSKSKTKIDFYKQPSVVALLSMIAYSIFLYVLHMIRVKVGF